MNKPRMKYLVRKVRNPVTKDACNIAQVTDNETHDLEYIVEFALKHGYVLGKQGEVVGVFRGCMEAVHELLSMGFRLRLDRAFVLEGTLCGTLNESLTLDSGNTYRIRMRPAKELEIPVDAFDWERVNHAGPKAWISLIGATSGGKNGEIVMSRAFVIGGRNLSYAAELGDRIASTWTEDGETKTADLTPSASSDVLLSFEWPSAWADLPAGTEIALELRLHGGDAENIAVPVAKTVKLVAAD